MEKFTDKKLNESAKELPKFFDKTKQEIYSLIKESVKANIQPNDAEKMAQIDNVDITLTGIDELTDKLYNLVQKEKIKEEIMTLESMKVLLSNGNPFNFQTLNEQIEDLKKRIK